MKSLSKIFKASHIQLDAEHAVKIDNTSVMEPPQQVVSGAYPVERPENERLAAVRKARAEAEAILRRAMDEAEQIRTIAEAERERLCEETLAQSRKEGYAEGYGKGVAEAEALKQEAQRLCEETLAERERTYAAIEPEMVELTLGIIKKLLGNAVSLCPQTVVNLIRQGLAEATITGTLTVRVAKADYEIVAAEKETLSAAAEGVEIELVRDVSLAPSDCIIETPFGNIDCSLDGQYESLTRNIKYILNASQTGKKID